MGVLGAGGYEGVMLRQKSKADDGMSGILAKSVDLTLGPITYLKPGGGRYRRCFAAIIGRYGTQMLLCWAV